MKPTLKTPYMKTLLERLSKLDRDNIATYFKSNYPNTYEHIINDLENNTNFCNIKLGTAYDLSTSLNCRLDDVIFKFTN